MGCAASTAQIAPMEANKYPNTDREYLVPMEGKPVYSFKKSMSIRGLKTSPSTLGSALLQIEKPPIHDQETLVRYTWSHIRFRSLEIYTSCDNQPGPW